MDSIEREELKIIILGDIHPSTNNMQLMIKFNLNVESKIILKNEANRLNERLADGFNLR